MIFHYLLESKFAIPVEENQALGMVDRGARRTI